MKDQYKVVGNKSDGYAVLENGAILYDLLDSRDEAKQICKLIRSGVGPEWDEIERALESA